MIFLLLAASTIYFFIKDQRSQQLLTNPQAVEKEAIQELTSRIGKLVELPKKETPVVAAVSDVNKLKNQTFFIDAQNGDKVLIYTKAQKVILYRPSTNKVINIGPVNLKTQESLTLQTQAPQTQNNVNVAIYNGTTKSGLAAKTESRLKDKLPNLTFGEITNASNTDYKKTLVIDLTGKNKALVSEISSFIQGQVDKLPKNEEKPQGDILIILGEE